MRGKGAYILQGSLRMFNQQPFKMKRLSLYLLPIILCFITGWLSSIMQSDALVEWYPQLDKPSITPPNAVFPIAWGIIYICMGLSLGRLLDIGERRFIGLWFLILALAFLWTPMFFLMQSPISGFAIILILDIATFSYIVFSWIASRFASIIMIPLLLWLLFATYLNFYIWLFN